MIVNKMLLYFDDRFMLRRDKYGFKTNTEAVSCDNADMAL